MAGNSKPINVLTSYKQIELKRVKVAINRLNLKHTSNSGQPLERDIDDPYTITYLVHMSNSEFGKLFRKISPNTIELPKEAYNKKKPIPESQIEPSSKDELVPEATSHQSSSCSSEDEYQPTGKSRNREKQKAVDTEISHKTKSRRRSIQPDQVIQNSPVHFEKRKDSRSRSRSRSSAKKYSRSGSPINKRSRSRSHLKSHSRSRSPSKRQNRSRSSSTEKYRSSDRSYSPSNRHSRRSRRRSRSYSPRYDSRSRSPKPTSTDDDCGRKPSSRSSDMRPEKSSRNSQRDRRSYSKSPSPGSRHHHRSRRSRDDSRERYRIAAHEPELALDPRPEFITRPEYYPRGFYNDPAMMRPHYPPTVPFYTPMPSFYAEPAIPRHYVPRPYFPRAANYRHNKPLPVYNNRAIPRFAATDVATVRSNAVAQVDNSTASNSNHNPSASTSDNT